MKLHRITWVLPFVISTVWAANDGRKNVQNTISQEHKNAKKKRRGVKVMASTMTAYERETQRSRIDVASLIDELEEMALNVNASSSSLSAASSVVSHLTSSLETRITKIFEKATSPSCRAKIATHFSYFLNAIGTEQAGLPFVGRHGYFQHDARRTCPEPILNFQKLPKNVTIEKLLKRSYPPPNEEHKNYEYVPADEIKLLYGVLMHGNAQGTLRLIDALQGGNTIFVIHVDGKEGSDDAYHTLTQFAKDREDVYIVPNDYRVRINWGGFSMVQATLNVLQYIFGLIPNDDGITQDHPLNFHKFIHLAASSYPLHSNRAIKDKLSSFPIDANFVYLVPKPLSPDPRAWHYFVECDDALHRIYRLTPLTWREHGVEIFTSSQWFIIGRDFSRYLAYNSTETYGRGSFLHEYIQYARHTMVADEHFFGTILKHTEFCTTHHNDNFLFVTFDRWESDWMLESRDQEKCLMPDPNKCGRSPTTLRKGDMFALELSGALFARKFSAEVDVDILDLIDEYRNKEDINLRDLAAGNQTSMHSQEGRNPKVDTEFEGLGALIIAKETVNSTNPLCLGLGPEGNKVRLMPCFRRGVATTLSQGWETGAVIEEEVKPNGRWSVGPCSSDGSLHRRPDTAEMESSPGRYTPEGPRCEIIQYGGPRHERCLDIQGERMEPGGQLQVYPCSHKWHQMFGFGHRNKNATTNGDSPVKGSIYGSVPMHILSTIQNKMRKGIQSDDDNLIRRKHQEEYKLQQQAAHLCIGASGRGDTSNEPWEDDKNRIDLRAVDFIPKEIVSEDGTTSNSYDRSSGSVASLDLWNGKYLVTVPCSDIDSVIEFLFVPFIEENNGEGSIPNALKDGLSFDNEKKVESLCPLSEKN